MTIAVWRVGFFMAITAMESALAATSWSQMQGLYDFYNATGGSNWIWRNQPWNFSAYHDPCTERWDGIMCNDTFANCRNHTCGIERLVLPGFGLLYSLPPSLEILTDLRVLSLPNNYLTGSIPDIFFGLRDLVVLALSNNSLTSTIPADIAKLQQLAVLDLGTNHLSGTIPAEFNTAAFDQTLSLLYLGENHLHGPIPSELGRLIFLRQLYLTANLLTGSVPASFASLSRLNYLGMSTNKLTGSIWAGIDCYSSLQHLYLNRNSLEGNIPLEMGSLQSLLYLEMSGNYLTGTIPSVLSHLRQLQVLELATNHLTGSIPTELVALTSVHTLQLQQNSIWGTIPQDIGQMASMKLLLLYSNRLHGTIPQSIGNMAALEELNIYENSLTGLIPSTLLDISCLRTLLVQNNKISGFEMNLDSPHASISMPCMEHLDISDNMFTGSIPAALFTALPSILSVAAVKNCFSGKIPESICLADSLQVLALDGLAAGSKCRTYLVDPFNLVDAYTVRALEGSIPSCMWALPNLTVFHLSGNGLTGTIPDIPTTSKLINISVSRNRLTGTVPRTMRRVPYVELNLGYNKLNGIYDDGGMVPAHGVRAIFNIENNRFSGFPPRHVESVDSIRVVKGNLFACSANHPIPDNDPEKEEYVCGSEQLDQTLILWAVVLFLGTTCGLVVWFMIRRKENYPLCSDNECGDSEPLLSALHENSRGDLINRIHHAVVSVTLWYDVGGLRHDSINGEVALIPDLATFISILRMLRKTSILIASTSVLVLLPLYVGLKLGVPSCTTYTNQYGWMFTAAFFSGVMPSVVMLLAFTALVCMVSYSFVMLYPVSIDHRITVHFRESLTVPRRCRTMQMSPQCIRRSSQISNIYTRIFVYASVILVNIIMYTCANAFYVYILLSDYVGAVKMTAKLVMAIFTVVWNVFIVPGSIEASVGMLNDISSQVKWMTAMLLLFNNIVAPTIATGLSDDSCYDDLFVHNEEIDAFYSYEYCEVYSVDVISGERECYRMSTLGFSTSYYPPFLYNHTCASAILVNYIPMFFITYAILTVIPPVVLVLLSYPCCLNMLPDFIRTSIPSLFWPPNQKYNRYTPLLKPNRIITNLMSHFAVLLTFGLACPFLSLAIACSICSVTALHQITVGRYLCYYTDCKTKLVADECTERLEGACSGILDSLPSCLWTILCGAALLFSYIIYDFVGDELAWENSLWFLVATLLVPLLGWMSLKLALRHTSRS